MSALVVRLAPVRNAVDQSARLGMPETRQEVINRVLGDIRAGHHPYLPATTSLQHLQQLGRAPEPDGAA